MQVAPGTRLGPYEIIERLGAGGMGEVWRARDTRLDRSVAIKIISGEFAADPAFVRRFEREARTISQLSHPNICTLHDVGDSYLVMELLAGETLSARIARGPLPLADVLRIGIEITSALAAAHRKGVVHRDLKPSNVMLTRTGAKLLDFGLAKAAKIDVTPDDATRQRELTGEGAIIGTFQYMSPEQLEGHDADPRSDIFALGAVLYEMATGRRAFEGKTKTSLIAAIVTGTPTPVRELQPLAPAGLDHVIATCLAKEPDDRWQSASDVANELRWVAAVYGEAAKSQRSSRASWLPWTIALIAIAAAAGLLVRPRATAPVQRAMQFTTTVPSAHAMRNPVFSPDGKAIAFVADDSNGKTLLWVRPVDSTTARPLGGTDDAKFPFWSPDGRYIGFFGGGKLSKVDVKGGAPQEIWPSRNGRGGSWNRDGVIIFAAGGSEGLLRVSASGGAATRLTTLDPKRGESSHRWPMFFSDGRHYLFTAASFGSNPDASRLGIYIGALDSPEQKLLIPAPSNVAYANGFLLFARESTLYAQRFDETRLAIEGEATPIATGIRHLSTLARADFAAHDSVLAYQAAPSQVISQFVWFDRSGKEIGRMSDRGSFANPRLSPTGDRLLYDATDERSGNVDVWLASTKGPLRQRLTFGVADDSQAIWSRDGQTILFNTYAGAAQAIGRRTLGGADEIIYRGQIGSGAVGMLDISVDGRSMIARENSRNADWDIKTFGFDGSKGVDLVATPAAETDARCSRNGKWIAYVSNDSGRPEVYLTTFPRPSATWQVSTGGGTEPKWRADSRELFYLHSTKRIMSVSISGDATPQLGAPQPLFRAQVREFISGTDAWTYDVSPDGRSFIANVQDTESADVPLTFSIGWDNALRQSK